VSRATILTGDCREVLATLPAASVQCVVTSPPYWRLRDYGVAGQLGLEATPDEYVAALVGVFREVRRVLRDDGCVWLNLGDTFAGQPAGNKTPSGFSQTRPSRISGNGDQETVALPRKDLSGLKPKDLIGIPWRVAFALQADGWWLRSDIIWAKPNPMPESVTDRPTKSHEYVFLLSKAERYYYDADAIAEPATDKGRVNGREWRTEDPSARPPGTSPRTLARLDWTERGRNARTVWTITTKPYPDAHFATFPPELPGRCILAGTSQRGCCPECGSPWERVVEYANDGTREHGPARALALGHSANGPTAVARAGDGRSSVTTGWQPTCDCYGTPPLLEYPAKPREPNEVPAWESACEPIRVERLRLLKEWGALSAIPCTILDPFGGSGTTAAVAVGNGRDAISIELNPAYTEMARRRIGPLFADAP
jgi:DNA modification methylase